ncbi:BTAD domain-containing putative transcriptional regulator, partial [Roseisolibacter sp. H3M3-2]|uniref:AfsR/SARP family transcriptional regulator n=1 Tax=Roseisolibacter sp. H3M3-2 TaxID=3031323 RepID=UPI0023D982A1
MSTLDGRVPHRLRTLGTLELTGPDGAPVPAHRRELLLLAYLAGRRGRAESRGTLATLLWEDREEARARGSLRQALFRLRKAIPDALTLDGETVALRPDGLHTDVEEMERHAAAGALDAAIAAWGGEFLGGEEPGEGSALREWADGERARVRAAFARVLERRLALLEASGDAATAIPDAERLVALDPLDAGATERLASALRRAGDPAAALRALDALAARRRAELGSGLPPRLTALAESVRGEVAAREAEGARAALRQSAAGNAVPADARGRVLAAWRHVADGADPVLLVEARDGDAADVLDALLDAAAADDAVVLAARGYPADR